MPDPAPIDRLLALPRFAGTADASYRPGFERIKALLAAMEQPHRRYRIIHIAGTNGKGSTAALIAAVLTSLGHRVGLHTSPHLLHVGERMRVNGTPASERWLAEAVGHYGDLLDRVQPSFFEATVALSFRYFAEQAVDWAVVEVGLGGRLDATNVVTPEAAVITHIGLDHADILGPTLAAIAREKAGIIKPGVPVFSGVDVPEAQAVIAEVAAEQQAPLHWVPGEVTTRPPAVPADERMPAGAVPRQEVDLQTPRAAYPSVALGLLGAHQRQNAAVAIRVCESFYGDALPFEAAVRAGLRDVARLTGLRGRLEIAQVQPTVALDVGHNSDGLRAALAALSGIGPGLAPPASGEAPARFEASSAGRLYVLFGTLRDKDAAGMLRLLAAAEAALFLTVPPGPRALPQTALEAHCREFGIRVVGHGSVADGLAWFARTARPADQLLVTGSHLVVAAAVADLAHTRGDA